MLRKILTALVLSSATPVFAEEPVDTTLLDKLEALAVLQATDLLNVSVRDYYEANSDIAQGKYPTLLHDAAIMGSLKLLKYLIKNDTHGIDFAYENGPTPLGYIAGDNQMIAAKMLLHAGANPNDMGNTDSIFPLSSAVTSGNMQMIQLLLKHDAEVHIGAYYQSPLGLTLEKNDIETLQLFDNYGFQLDSMNDELRIIVTEYLNSDFVEEDVLKILKLHGFDIYTKTAEKASFFTEYSKKIEHSDVRQMLQDLYEAPPTKTESTSTTTNEEQVSTDAKLAPDTVSVENSEDTAQINNTLDPAEEAQEDISSIDQTTEVETNEANNSSSNKTTEEKEEPLNSNGTAEAEVNTINTTTRPVLSGQEAPEVSSDTSDIIETEPSTTETIEDLDNKDNIVKNIETTSKENAVDDMNKGELPASPPVSTDDDVQNNMDN